VYADQPTEATSTLRTGFDPRGANLFRALVEAAYLVANADDHFDDDEQATFAQLVADACDDAVPAPDLDMLVGELALDLATGGMDERIAAVVASVTTDEQRLEVFRVATVMAYASSGMNATERSVLDRLSEGLGLDSEQAFDVISRADS
jgi:tellurite resistance protein